MEYTTLNNGIKMPVEGIGTFMMSPAQAEDAVYNALNCGYRMIDTANAYMNEKAVGRGIRKSGVAREDIFLVTKLWPSVYADDTAVDKTLARLGVDYVDLLFIHQPAGDFMAGYRQLEKAYKEGKIKSIGISNFHGEKLEKLLAECEIKPQVIQLEAHPYFTQDEIMVRLKEYGTRLMAWYPLGHGDKSLIQEPVFTALAEKYGKSNAQIILRWHTQEYNIPAPLTDGYSTEWEPVIDGGFLPTEILTEDGGFAAAGRDVTLLIGSNLNEWTGFGFGGDSGSVSTELAEAFAAAYPDLPADQASRVDTLIRPSIRKIAVQKANQGGAPVYSYVFTYSGGGGSYHGAELSLIFRNDGMFGGGSEEMKDTMSSLWVSFARDGVPSADGVPAWEPFDREDGATMIIDETSKLAYHHDQELLALLAPAYEY